MPYIKQEYRQELSPVLEDLIDTITCLPHEDENGIITYVIYSLIDNFYTCNSFNKLSDGIKVLECAKMEYYAKKIRPYEEKAIVRNGDIE